MSKPCHVSEKTRGEQIYGAMVWHEKEPPLYVGSNDTWIRAKDGKKFSALVQFRVFVSKDGERIDFNDHTWIFKV